MSKPTLIQTLLKRPSQTYSFPHDKDYFSSRQEMLRIATEAQHVAPSPKQKGMAGENTHNHFTDSGQMVQSGTQTMPSITRPSPQQLRRELSSVVESSISSVVDSGSNHLLPDQLDESESSDSDYDIFYTPNTSPRTSMASSLAFPLITAPRKSSRRSLRTVSNEFASNSQPNADPSSLSPSMAPALSSFNKPLLPPAPAHYSSTAVPYTRIPPATAIKSTSTNRRYNFSTDIASASTSSFSSASLDGHSLFSDLMTGSTESTTPVNSRSDLGHSSKPTPTSKGRMDNYTATATRTPTARSTKQSQLQLRNLPKQPQRNYTYTDDDWAKDVRWLAPPGQNTSDESAKSTVTPIPAKRKTQAYKGLGHGKPQPNVKPEPTYYTASHGMPLPPSSSTPKALPRQVQMQMPMPSAKGVHAHTPSIMMSMTALLEEDEDGPLTPRMERGNSLDLSSSVKSSTQGGLKSQHSIASARTQPQRVRTSPAGDVSVPLTQDTSTIEQPRRSRASEVHLKHRRSRSLGHDASPLSSRSTTTTATTFSSFNNALPMGTGELPSYGTPGYTSLHLARAPPGVLNSRGTGTVDVKSSLTGKVDLTRSGVAQTTMASVEVVRGLGSEKKGLLAVLGKGMGFSRTRTVSGGERQRSRSVDGHGRIGLGGFGGASENSGGSSVLGFTSYRKPPGYVPSGSVLVQVWAVGVDGVDGRLVGVRMGSGWSGHSLGSEEVNKVEGVSAPQFFQARANRGKWKGNKEEEGLQREEFDKEEEVGEPFDRPTGSSGLGRSVSLRSKLTLSRSGSKKRKLSGNGGKEKELPPPPVVLAEVGYIPGRSFVGRVLECGWEVKEQAVRKGEWVVGLLDVKKCGALTEFIVVDRRRVHRVPYPAAVSSSPSQFSSSLTSLTSSQTAMASSPQPQALSLEELALLPLCGIPSYRAIRTLMYAFSTSPMAATSSPTSTMTSMRVEHFSSDHEVGRRRRALVLRGHNGVGAMVVQMLAVRGWRISVHVPVPGAQESEEVQKYMSDVEDRVRLLGGEEVVFDDGGNPTDAWWDDGRGAAVRVIDGLREDGDVFDAVLDTIGGKDVREASERLLRSNGGETAGSGIAIVSLDGQSPIGKNEKKNGIGQFTTLVGDVPERTIPTVGDNFRAGLRSLKLGTGDGGEGGATGDESKESKNNGKVGYAWISVAQEVDWEGDDISESIGNVLRLALDHGIRPVSGPKAGRSILGIGTDTVIPFERTPEVFVDGGMLGDGGTMVVRIVG